MSAAQQHAVQSVVKNPSKQHGMLPPMLPSRRRVSGMGSLSGGAARIMSPLLGAASDNRAHEDPLAYGL